MDGSRFDHWTRMLSRGTSRRTLVGAASGILAGLLGSAELTAAKKKKPKKKPRKKTNCPKGQRRCGRDCCTSVETCKGGRCVHHCNDGIKNQGETSRDCGGTCRNRKKCGLRQLCDLDPDCQSGICTQFTSPTNPLVGFCAECRVDSQCTNPAKPRCIGSFCHECAADFDCANTPDRPFCIATNACPPGIPCECSQCRPGQNDCPPGEFCIRDLRICFEDECLGNADCASGCCDVGIGICSIGLMIDPNNCGTCGNSCPGGDPACRMCCNGICRQVPRGEPGPNECVCP